MVLVQVITGTVSVIIADSIVSPPMLKPGGFGVLQGGGGPGYISVQQARELVLLPSPGNQPYSRQG